ncbi:MAG: FkbM family methyltransferase [Balneolales bacterium]
MLKRTVKKILYNIPINSFVFGFIKKVVIPPYPIRRHMTFKGKFLIQNRDGKQLYLTNNSFRLENELFWLGLDDFDWEVQTRKLWIHLCKQSETIFDIGANIGIFSMLAKVYSPNSSVYAFEPQPNIYKVLSNNNNLNQFDVRCENIALSDKEGEIPFYNFGPEAFEGNTTAGSLNKHFRPEDQRSIMVSATKLDHYLTSHKLEGIDLIKLDVETHEPEILKGYGESLLMHKPVIILEVQDEEIGKRIESLIPQKEYLYYNIDEKAGLKKVSNIGLSHDKNYLLCPKSKVDKIQDYK